MKGIVKVLIGGAVLLTFHMPSTSAGMQNAPKSEELINQVAENIIDLSLKQISSRSWESADINSIIFCYDGHIDNIIIEGDINDRIRFDEYNSVDDKAYAANTTLENGTLIITQSQDEPSTGHDSEARLFIPEDYSGAIKVTDSGNIRISSLDGSASFDITNDSGVVSFMSVNAQEVKINVPNSVSGNLTMRDVKAFVDITVIGRITINGNTEIGGTIKGSDGTYCSTIVTDLTALRGDLDIQNKYGPTAVDFAADASFKIDVNALNISLAYPGDSFQNTRTSLKGSCGVKPEFSLTSESGTFTLGTRN